jgi:hypothetical protein
MLDELKGAKAFQIARDVVEIMTMDILPILRNKHVVFSSVNRVQEWIADATRA